MTIIKIQPELLQQLEEAQEENENL
jgi:hypothetical protein